MNWVDLTYDDAFHRDFRAAERKWQILSAMRERINRQGLPADDTHGEASLDDAIAEAERLLAEGGANGKQP